MIGDIKNISLGFVNAYLVRTEEGFILIDTGVSFQWTRLERELTAAGCRPGNLKLVVITHGDWDHTGSCAKLQSRYGAKIAMHKNDCCMAESGVQRKRTVNSPFMRFFMSLGRLGTKFQKGGLRFETFKPDILLTDGQSLADFGWNAKVMHTPGHTEGSVIILTEEGSLFSGDTLVNMRKPGITPIVEDAAALKRSVEAIVGLNAGKVFPGHGKPFTMDHFKLK